MKAEVWKRIKGKTKGKEINDNATLQKEITEAIRSANHLVLISQTGFGANYAIRVITGGSDLVHMFIISNGAEVSPILKNDLKNYLVQKAFDHLT